jgi:hypothetical protein
MPRSKKIHQRLTIVLQAIIFLGLILAVYERQWLNVFLIVGILFLTMLPNIIGRRFALYIPAEFELLAILFIFASLFLGEIRGYYVKFWWWDVVLHASSGFLLGILGFLLIYALNQEERIELYMKPGFVALFSFAFAVAVGSIWEIFEFTMDSFLGMNMQKSGLIDTMWDLIVDALGALVIVVLGYFYTKSGTEYFVEKWIDKFIQANPKIFRKQQRRQLDNGTSQQK